MQLNTKQIKEVYIDRKKYNQSIVQEKKAKIQQAAEQFNSLFEELGVLLDKPWIEIENMPVYYSRGWNLLIPNPLKNKFKKTCMRDSYIETAEMKEVAGFKGQLMDYEQAKAICFMDSDSPYYQVFDHVVYKEALEVAVLSYSKEIGFNTQKFMNLSTQDNVSLENTVETGFARAFRNLNISMEKAYKTILENSNTGELQAYTVPVYKFKDTISREEILIKYNLMPVGLSKQAIRLFGWIRDLYNKGYVDLGSKRLFTEAFLVAVMDNKIESIGDISFSVQEDSGLSLNEIRKTIYDELLNCDRIRADIESYDTKVLEDINRGHWELWHIEPELSKVPIKMENTFIARNPLADIKKGGVIGIDFGTKSTIVVSQEDTSQIMPLRVGMGRLGKKVSSHHYENPTVIEFRDIEGFLGDYYSKEGRPKTRWEDLTVSHTAFNNMLASESSKYYAFMEDLKQWAGHKGRYVKVVDYKAGTEKLLEPYLELGVGDLDPIELYAYYLGLYINNMHNGIFLEYILSFPVTYEKAIRTKIIDSFTRGLKQAMPKEVLDDEESMKVFSVVEGASEPAAYAVCALQEYGFELEEDEDIFYGVFDFGGGTTDFDFGVWKEADASNRRYDYEIRHFGAGGDKYLGGENLLELMAFEVFKENQEVLRENRITFLLPPEGKRFAGSETLISQSQEAKLNIKQLKEKLRPLWERREGYESLFKNNRVKVNLYDRDGKHKMNFELEVDQKKLEDLLRGRIEKGVQNFFEALKLTFNREDTKKMKQVVIFLAGNSSKSQFVVELFKKHIDERTQYLKNSINSEEEYFVLYPPLGTNEAYKIMVDKHINIDPKDLTRPTGKTGVAFGLLQCRRGGRIKVVSEDTKHSEEIHFQYYIGYERKRKFKVSIDKLAPYQVWHNYIDASESVFEIYYTNLPQATTNKIPINEGIKKLRLNSEIINDEANIYIRVKSPSEIEYVVATEEGIEKAEYLSAIKKVQLD